MRKKYCLLFVSIVLLLCGATLAACGGKKTDEERGPLVTYYLYNDTLPMTAYASDGSFTLPVQRMPHKDHCTFLGLFDDKTGGTQIVDVFGRCNIVIQSDITLWAHWQGNNCGITFDAGDGTLPSDSQSMTLVYGSTIPDLPVPEWEGHDFIGWMSGDRLISNGSKPNNVTFNDENFTFEPNSDAVHLEAKYEWKQLTVTLDYNDGTYRTETCTVQYGNGLESVTFPEADTGKSEIVGWSIEKNRDVPFSGVFETDITLYAVWRDYKVFKFYTDPDIYTEHKVYRDEEYEIPAAEKGGYNFDGWYTSATYSGLPVPRVSYNSTFTSYYAKWDVIEYHITFDVDGGDAPPEQISYTVEQTVALPDAGYKPNYKFVGWCRKQDRSDTPVNTLPKGTYGDITLYAKWRGEDRTVILDPQDGEVSAESCTVEYGAPFRLPVPVRVGYDFLGWYTGRGAKITDTDGGGIDVFVFAESETTLYAHWQIKTYTVEYRTNGGSSVPVQKYEHGQSLEFPEPPTMQNMEFEGWYCDAELSKGAKEGIPVIENMIFYAKWIQMTVIRNAADLKAIAEQPDYNYCLAADINLDGENWAPIESFSGTFDGKNHKIYNFTISATSTVTNLGFFGVNLGVIRNLILEGVVFNYTATYTTSVGVLTGTNSGTLDNCVLRKSDVTVHGNIWNDSSRPFLFGGIVGENNGTVSNCSATDTKITATHDSSSWQDRGDFANDMFLGGLIGADNGQTSGCYSNLEIDITQSASNQSNAMFHDGKPQSRLYAGGLTGRQSESGASVGCLSQSSIKVTVDLDKCYATDRGWYGTFACVGGLVGIAEGSIESCKAAGALDTTALNVEGYVGGLAGKACGDIKNSYALSTIQVNRSVANQATGGFVAVNQGTVRNCYSGGTIGSQRDTTGGFCGRNLGSGVISRCFSVTKLECEGKYVAKFNAENEGTISNCYYSNNVTVLGTYAADVASEKDSNEILRYDFLADELYWDPDVWTIYPNGLKSPELKWESK